jgi:biotin synthase-like enzyme
MARQNLNSSQTSAVAPAPTAAHVRNKNNASTSANAPASAPAAATNSQSVPTTVRQIIESALAGAALDSAQVRALLELDSAGQAAAWVCAQADALSRRAAQGQAYIYGQIGLDARPCAGNCTYCSFAVCNQPAHANAAAQNAEGVTGEQPAAAAGKESASDTFDTPLENVLDAAATMAAGGVHLISLMSTASYPAEKLAQDVASVRQCVGPRVVLMANGPDISLEQARALKAAGAGAYYHAVRLGEGKVTSIEPETRWQTIENATHAGLSLMTGVEPLCANYDSAQVASRITEIARLEPAPFCVGVCRLTPLAQSAWQGGAPATPEDAHLVAAVLRLAVGTRVPIGCAGGVAWVDSGQDPRQRGFAESSTRINASIKKARQRLRAAGWEIATSVTS